MLQSFLSRSAAAVTFAAVTLLAGAPVALAAPPLVAVSGSRADGDTMPGTDDHGSMPGTDDHGSMPGMDHGSMPNAEPSSHGDHDPMSASNAGHEAGAEPSSDRPRGLVLGVFAGVNGAVMAAAAVVRRRTGDRRRRHLTRRARAVAV